MLLDRSKVEYFAASLRRRLTGQPMICPSCGGNDSHLIQRKYWVTELRRCCDCRLMYRYPRESGKESAAFYNTKYAQGFTTDLPSAPDLEGLLHAGFRGHEKDYGTYIEVIRALGVKNRARLLDYGASWGYGTWQLARAGFDVQGFEVSRVRAAYGRDRLGLELTHLIEEVKGPFDVFFSSHVLEHVPSISDVLRVARRVLRPGGLFVAFTPNGSSDFKKADPRSFTQLWGRVHPNFLDDEFYRCAFESRPLLLASPPYDMGGIRFWDRSTMLVLDLRGSELLAAAIC